MILTIGISSHGFGGRILLADDRSLPGIEGESAINHPDLSGKSEQSVKKLELTSPHLKLIQVVLNDATDHNNELVQENEWLLHPNEGKIALTGNLFLIEDSLNQTGHIFIKRAPLPGSRTIPSGCDFKVTPQRGGETTVLMYENGSEDTWTVLKYKGGVLGRAKALQDWQASQRPATEGHRLPRFLSNTWGDRSRDGRMREDFILAEIDAADQLGVDVLQLDDGWQQGTSANSKLAHQNGGVWEGFWHTDPDFWEVNRERFPNGLENVVEHAREKGIQLGLWYAPDSWNDLANWRKDADQILELYRTYGITHFKVDSINATTDLARQNLHAFFDRVLTESGGEVVFDLDITAGKRPGYFGEMTVGPLFVENRYTDWGSYWPHQTLRNLWQLSRWVDPTRLRMEFLNNERNTWKYKKDPLAPAQYKADTLFATVMFANPLGWFECSNLSDQYVAEAAPLIRTWKRHREELFDGTILPIGKEPDGIAYTGFMSIAPEGNRGYILVFRELNPEDQASIEIPEGLDLGQANWELLSSNGEVKSNNDRLRVQIPERLGYVFARFTIN
ncbi:alpha-galactosidase [Coraliomargarita parva]|uniref:alpha-galactosidase n=1 Tax=Coraliomargarita parva TaxID=3014050 RepID=UPI0022B5C6A9|nr:alpha-galactosidase [Coraliomargarita parva]